MPDPTQNVTGRALLERAKAAVAASQAVTKAIRGAAAQLPPKPPQGPPGPPSPPAR